MNNRDWNNLKTNPRRGVLWDVVYSDKYGDEIQRIDCPGDDSPVPLRPITDDGVACEWVLTHAQDSDDPALEKECRLAILQIAQQWDELGDYLLATSGLP